VFQGQGAALILSGQGIHIEEDVGEHIL